MSNPNYPEGVTEKDIDRICEPMPLTEEPSSPLLSELDRLYNECIDHARLAISLPFPMEKKETK